MAKVAIRVTLTESSRKLPRHVAWGEVAKANQARRASVLKRTLSPVSEAWRSTS
ncbi:hypothetical protein ACLK2F_19220 [Escherichia coli]